ncbi:hypothetical protein C8Q73DRAFT_795759 [Cubamyces lactineus]|nr:hypothetical protein C8Q73DRAFT_795759 [Cubamyces lactineus]
MSAHGSSASSLHLGNEPTSPAEHLDALLRSFLLAQLLKSAVESSDEENNADQQPLSGPSAPSMPTPVVMPHPFVANIEGARPPPPMPEPQFMVPPPPPPFSQSMPSPWQIPQVPDQHSAPSTNASPATNGAPFANPAPSTNPPPPPPPPPPRPTPPRPPSPDDTDVARTTMKWRLFLIPLSNRICEALYEQTRSASLPSAVTGDISYLKLDGYGARDSVENMCALIQFLLDNRWEEQVVDKFIDLRKAKPEWPAKLKDQPHSQHVHYVWLLMNGLLAVIGLKPYLEPDPPATFAGIVPRIFPPLEPAAVKPQRFSFTARELIEEGFVIQPTSNLLDHLKLVGNAVNVYTLSSDEIQLLMGYDQNRAARAIGLSNLGGEILHSYVALVEGEFHECYRLPISLGMFKIDDERVKRGQYDDLTVVTGVLRLYRNDRNGDRQPHLLASRVLVIERALRKRRHWYNRLRRDIHKRKKEEPWMFWGAVLAVFFGVCTVIQTVTSVWSLVASLG